MELDPIIHNGFLEVMLFEKSILDHAAEEGLPALGVGGIGSSFAAFLLGITEINPLPAHYYCPHCHHFEWPEGMDPAGSIDLIDYDLPEKACPVCGHKLTGDGFNIPFENLTTCHFNRIPYIMIRAEAATIRRLQQWIEREYREEPHPDEPLYIETQDIGELLASDKAKALLQECEPSLKPTFLNQMRVLAIVEAPENWGQDITSLDENIPFFREDIYQRLVNSGVSREYADATMTGIRKGRLTAEGNAWMVETMEDAGLDPAFIDNCKKIRYIRNKADLAAELLQYRKHESL